MLFNSLEFLFFLPLVFALHFALPPRWRWLWLLVASYYFYMSWRPIYGVLLFLTTLIDYVVAIQLGRIEAPTARRLWLWVSLATNLGMLFYFKYYNFVTDSLNHLLSWTQTPVQLPQLNVVLPIGISFYVLQTLGYTIDVYRRRLAPERHLGIFMLYVSFFPQLVAGPIERAGHLLPQLRQKHAFDAQRAGSGLVLMAWGFFKKLVIADNLAFYVDPIFADPAKHNGFLVLLAAYFFAFQIYCDFSGYSDIAIGCARIFGVDLMQNFRRPFLSTSPREFWRRWHISLTTWFRDYIYFPLGGSRGVSEARADANLFAVFALSGLWHGAQWTYVIWGVLHGCYVLIGKWTKLDHWAAAGSWRPLRQLIGMVAVFNLFSLSMILFRAESLADAMQLYAALLRIPSEGTRIVSWGLHYVLFPNLIMPSILFVGVAALMAVEIFQEWGGGWRALRPHLPTPIRWVAYYLLVMAIIIFGSFSQQTIFIYFQF